MADIPGYGVRPAGEQKCKVWLLPPQPYLGRFSSPGAVEQMNRPEYRYNVAKQNVVFVQCKEPPYDLVGSSGGLAKCT